MRHAWCAHCHGTARAQPSFFEPLRRTFRLHFAEDFGAELSSITNNYALYAVETLLFFGSQASVESLSFQSGWFVDACFPGASLRAVHRQKLSLMNALGRPWGSAGVNATAFAAAQAAYAGAVDIQCRDGSGVLVNGVLYGPACGTNLPCGRNMYLAPQPRACGQPRLPDRLMLANRTTNAYGLPRSGPAASRKCAVLGADGRGELRATKGAKKSGGAKKGSALGNGGERREARAAQGVAHSARSGGKSAVAKVQGFLHGAALAKGKSSLAWLINGTRSRKGKSQALAQLAAGAVPPLKPGKKRGGGGAAGKKLPHELPVRARPIVRSNAVKAPFTTVADPIAI